MPTFKLAFASGLKAENAQYVDAIPVNMYVDPRDDLGGNGFVVQHPGIELFANGIDSDKGGFYNSNDNTLYRVSGNDVVTVGNDGAVKSLAKINTDGQASFAYSQLSTAIVSGGRYYRVRNGVVTDINIPDESNRKPIDVCRVDDYYVFCNENWVFHTKATSETDFNPFDYAGASFLPDKIKGVEQTQTNQLLVFGRYSTEVFRNTGGEPAFTRVNSSYKLGIVGTHCKTELNGVFWCLGSGDESSLSFYVIGGGQPQNFSTATIDKILQGYTESELEGAVMESRRMNGLDLVQVNLPRHTLLYNVTVAQRFGSQFAWSELKSDGGIYRGLNAVHNPKINQWIVGDRYNGNIGHLSESTILQYNVQNEWAAYSSLIKIPKVRLNSIELEPIITDTKVNDAQFFMSATFNGVNYGNEVGITYNSAYGERIKIHGIGMAKNFLGLKIRGIADVKMAFGVAYVEY